MKEYPLYWDYLSETDKEQYLKLQKDFETGTIKKVRNGRMETFEEVLEEIKRFCIQENNSEDNWKRFLVCGICWMDQAIAINTRQLKLLVCKCKSSINGSLQKIGYTTNQAHSESWKILFPKIPLLKDRYQELRKWTIRYKPGFAPDPLVRKVENDRVITLNPDIKKAKRNIVEPVHPINDQRITVLQASSFPLKFKKKMSRIPRQVVV